MTLSIRSFLIRASALGVSLLGCTAAFAITPDALQQELAKANPPTVIDVRAVELFSQGHVDGAINIPASLVPLKKLPRLGRVVVYGDGLSDDETKAVAALNAKPGIQAELLVGGYAAWETDVRATTGKRGLSPEKAKYITYAQLQATTGNVVLVDLRTEPAAKKKQSSTGSVSQDAPAPLTDLTKAFPGKPITKSPQNLPQAANGKAASAGPPILVLIDNGDGVAQKTARDLRAQGNTRVVILAGGELTVARQGERGSQRTGMNVSDFNKAITGAAN
jgi:rhodanese-related sulfurtransferase